MSKFSISKITSKIIQITSFDKVDINDIVDYINELNKESIEEKYIIDMQNNLIIRLAEIYRKEISEGVINDDEKINTLKNNFNKINDKKQKKHFLEEFYNAINSYMKNKSNDKDKSFCLDTFSIIKDNFEKIFDNTIQSDKSFQYNYNIIITLIEKAIEQNQTEQG